MSLHYMITGLLDTTPCNLVDIYKISEQSDDYFKVDIFD
jgi:hypothetical protein